YVRCPECDGKRFQPHILRIRLDGKSIHDVLEMTVSESIRFFENGSSPSSKIVERFRILEEVGLGYLRLGQPLNILSGGESQRLKLVGHLRKTENVVALASGQFPAGRMPMPRGNLFIFDEPTTGLHFDDVAMLLQLFQRLVGRGHSIMVIEHNLEVIKCADWIVDLGPDAGDTGGDVV